MHEFNYQIVDREIESSIGSEIQVLIGLICWFVFELFFLCVFFEKGYDAFRYRLYSVDSSYLFHGSKLWHPLTKFEEFVALKN